MLCGVIRCVGDDGVGKCRFSVDGGFQVCGCSVDGYVLSTCDLINTMGMSHVKVSKGKLK